MTTLPTWAVLAVSLGTPTLTLAGVLLAQAITRRGARELESRSRREETMRNLRWAAELAMHADHRMADLGVAQLTALLSSDVLDDAEKIFVEAALDVVYRHAEGDLDTAEWASQLFRVVVDDDRPAIPTEGYPGDTASGDGGE